MPASKTAPWRARDASLASRREPAPPDVPSPLLTAPESAPIRVVVRIRPLSPAETARGDAPAWSVAPPSTVAPVPGATKRKAATATGFAAALGPEAGGEDVYRATSLGDAVPSLLRGRCVAALVYGATGSGKTHTMLGRGGLAERALRDLFAAVEAAAALPSPPTIRVAMTFVELHNERARCLLAPWAAKEAGAAPPPPGTRPPSLPLRPLEGGPPGAAIVAGATVVPVATAIEALTVARAGAAARAAAATPRNAASSRSHAVLTVAVDVVPGDGSPSTSATLVLADLAGSECGATAPSAGPRRVEGASINRSLLALGAVIDALAAAADGGRPRRVAAWRDSKLTRVAAPALAGAGSRAALIATLAPGNSADDVAESLSTLSFAARAARVPVVSHVVGGGGGGALVGVPPWRAAARAPSPSLWPQPPSPRGGAAAAAAVALEARVSALEAALAAEPRSPKAALPAAAAPATPSPLKRWPWRRRQETPPASPGSPPHPPCDRPRVALPPRSTLARLPPAALDALACELADAAEAVRAEAASRARRGGR